MIEFDRMTKRYGGTLAVHELSFTVRPGLVTGLLGPNGAGKSTSMRVLLGLDHPTSGRARVGGRLYGDLSDPLRTVGAHLDARSVHPGRPAREHLKALARSNRIAASRVDEVLELVGLAAVARSRTGTYSLGMSQRLGIAAALLGDPEILVFDEPVNGLDTDGVLWIRGLLRGFADQGRTVLVSSHLMAEMHQTADHVVVLGRGRVLADCATEELAGRADGTVVVRSPDPGAAEALRAALPAAAVTAAAHDREELHVTGAGERLVGEAAHDSGIPVHHLARRPSTLEAGYLRLVADDVEYTGGAVAAERT
ncbi:ATP-binding cassette domain-containing protein [Streptomonospora sediminis]